MTQWWPSAYSNKPWDTWFYAPIASSAWGWPGYNGSRYNYWFKKISASGGHRQQLAIRSDVSYPWISGVQMAVQANVIYVCCYLNDTPNYGSYRSVNVGPPCANWVTALYSVIPEVTRDQTGGMRAAVAKDIDLSLGFVSAIAKQEDLEVEIYAAIAGDVSVECAQRAAIQGDVDKQFRLKAAIKGWPSITLGLKAATAINPEVACGLDAIAQGDLRLNTKIRAAIKGDTEIQSGITAWVIVSRKDQILLELENKFPQENDLRSVPNWPSSARDWRRQPLGS